MSHCLWEEKENLPLLGSLKGIFWGELQGTSNLLPSLQEAKRWTGQKWGCAKGAAKQACGETVVQTPKNGQQKVVNQKPAARLPRKDSHLLDQGHLWFQAFCDRRLRTENILFGAHRRIANTRPPLSGTKLSRTKTQCFNFIIFIWNRTRALPWRQGWTPRNTTKRSALEMQGKNPQFSWTIFLDKKCTLQKPANGLSKKP